VVERLGINNGNGFSHPLQRIIMNEYKNYTAAQLKLEAKALGIKVKAKNPGKPNKTEYIAAIMNHLNYGADEAVEGMEKSETSKVETPEDPKSTRKPQTEAELIRLEMFRKDRVVIHDIQENQTKDKDELLPVSWGNRLLGGQTDFVSLNGKPQYVRVGALNNLRDATTVVHEKGENSAKKHVVKRFVITDVAGFTPEQLKELADKQRLRNAKYA
jgi:hypothetical protein